MGTGGGLFVIDFTEQGNSAHFRREGWSDQESDRVWGIGPRAVLRVPIQSSGRSVILEAEIGPRRAPPEILGQIVRVGINGTPIGWVRMETRSMLRCEIEPPLFRQDGILNIEFGFPGFFRSDALSTPGENRPLSGWFSFMRLYTTDLFKPGPHFPSSRPEIPVVGLWPPVAAPDTDIRPMPVAYTFASGGTGKKLPRTGWLDGKDGLSRMVAPSGQITLPAVATLDPHVLRLDLEPATAPRASRAPEITVVLDNIAVGQFSVDESGTQIVALPRELTRSGEELALTFVSRPAAEGEGPRAVPGPSSPGIAIRRIGVVPLPAPLASTECLRLTEDGRRASNVISARSPPKDMAALARGFESLGSGPEFGIAQRKLGSESLNFFRYCTGTIQDVSRALGDDLRAVVDLDSVTIERSASVPGEYVFALAAYHLYWPAPAFTDEAGRDALSREFATTLFYLRRKFFEGLRGGRKIYVVNQSRPIPIGQAMALLLELNRHGHATLLCVEPASNGRRPGEVERVMPNLMRGYLDATDVDGSDRSGWVQVMANAMPLGADT